MESLTIKQFSSDEVELILLRLKLSNIESEFWLDIDGFFNYRFSAPSISTLTILKKSPDINWTRIDEVVSQMAYDASLFYPASIFSSWYNDQEGSSDVDAILQESSPQNTR